MKKDAMLKKKPFLFFFLYFLSACSFFLLISVFRPYKLKIFLCLAAAVVCAFYVFKKKELLLENKTKDVTWMALCIESIAFFDFYFDAIHNEKTANVIDILSPFNVANETRNIIVAIVGIGLCSIGFFFAKTISSYLLTVAKRVFGILKENKVSFFSILSVNIVSFIAIIRANYYYTDDLGRSVYGYGMEGAFSRYISSLLSKVVHGNSWLADVSPLSQLIALAIVSVAAVLLLHILSETINKKITKWSFVALVPICLSPYFLTCLSYKYDAPYMALSVLVSILPLVFYKSNTVFYSASVFIGMLMMCMTYQVSSGIFSMLVMMMSLMMWMQKTEYKKIFRFILSSALSYLSALVAFKLVLRALGEGDYVDTSVAFNKLIPNVNNYLNILNDDLPTIWKLLFFAIVIFFIVIVINITQQKKILSVLAAFFVGACSFILSFGVYIVFNNPLTATRAFYGVGVFASILCCFIFLVNESVISKLPVVCLSGMFVIYCFAYGNALDVQQEYLNFRTEQIINDCVDLDLLKEDEPTKIKVIGNAGYHRALKNMFDEYPLLKRQIPILLCDSDYFWGAYRFKEYYGLNVEINNSDAAKPSKDDLLKDTYYHSIYKVDDTIVIKVKDVESAISK